MVTMEVEGPATCALEMRLNQHQVTLLIALEIHHAMAPLKFLTLIILNVVSIMYFSVKRNDQKMSETVHFAEDDVFNTSSYQITYT